MHCGKYNLPLPPGAHFQPTCQRLYLCQSQNHDPILRAFPDPIELVPLEPKVDAISAAGGTASNSVETPRSNLPSAPSIPPKPSG